MSIIGNSLAFILSVAASYLVGSIPTSFLFAKAIKGLDIRQVGSGNAGATNVFRSVGKIAGIATLVIDIIKGAVVVTLMTQFFYTFVGDLDYDFFQVFLGFAAVCGHIWPVFLKFHGGKGVATTLGVAIGIAPILLVPSVMIWIAVFAFTRYVSLASILALLTFPAVSALAGRSIYLTVFSAIICFISIYKHKENIVRLTKGQEHKIELGRKK